MTNIYVGNLPLSATAEEVVALFKPHGTVHKFTLMLNEETGESRGFAFVEMDDDEAQVAIDELDGVELEERRLRINVSRDRGAKAPRRAF